MWTEIGGRRTFFETSGDRGTPVLLVMGFGISGRAWAPQVRELEQQHRVAFFDNRGIGETEPSSTPYLLDDLADDSMRLLDILGWDNAHVVGVSMGGMISQHIGLRHKDRVRSLTLIATHPGGSPHRWFPTARGLRLFLRANTSAGDVRISSLRNLLYTDEFVDNPALDDFPEDSIEMFAVPADRRTLMYQLRAIFRHQPGRRLAQLQDVPTLIVRPDQDKLVRPTASDHLHKLIPGSVLLGIQRGGHGVTHERAGLVNKHLLAHFAEADRHRPDTAHAAKPQPAPAAAMPA